MLGVTSPARREVGSELAAARVVILTRERVWWPSGGWLKRRRSHRDGLVLVVACSGGQLAAHVLMI